MRSPIRQYEHTALALLLNSGQDAGPWATPFVSSETPELVHLYDHARPPQRTTQVPLAQPVATGHAKVCNVCVYAHGRAPAHLEPWRVLMERLLQVTSKYTTVQRVADLEPGTATPDDLVAVAAQFNDLYRGSLEHPTSSMSRLFTRIRALQTEAPAEAQPAWGLVCDVLDTAFTAYDTARRKGHATRRLPSGTEMSWSIIDVHAAEPLTLPDGSWPAWVAAMEQEPLAVADRHVLVRAPVLTGVSRIWPITPVPDTSPESLQAALSLWESGTEFSVEDFEQLLGATQLALSA